MECEADACLAEAVVRISPAIRGKGPHSPVFLCQGCWDTGLKAALARKPQEGETIDHWKD